MVDNIHRRIEKAGLLNTYGMVSLLHLRPHGILHLALFVSVGLARGIFGQVDILVSTVERVGYANGQDV